MLAMLPLPRRCKHMPVLTRPTHFHCWHDMSSHFLLFGIQGRNNYNVGRYGWLSRGSIHDQRFHANRGGHDIEIQARRDPLITITGVFTVPLFVGPSHPNVRRNVLGYSSFCGGRRHYCGNSCIPACLGKDIGILFVANWRLSWFGTRDCRQDHHPTIASQKVL